MTNPNAQVTPWTAEDGSPRDGLTKRELFAAMAMQGLCAHHEIGQHADAATLAKYAVEQADALIAELNKESE